MTLNMPVGRIMIHDIDVPACSFADLPPRVRVTMTRHRCVSISGFCETMTLVVSVLLMARATVTGLTKVSG